MTTHKTIVHAKCPINGEWDYYDVSVETDVFIAAEEVQEACNSVRGSEMTQEDLTARLHHLLTEPETESRVTVRVEGRHGQNTSTVCVAGAK